MSYTLAEMQKATYLSIPEGEAGIRETLKQMVKITKQFRSDVALRQLASTLFREAQLAQGDFWGEVVTLHAFVRDSIRYMGDVHDIETLQTPQVTLQIEAGDCDDKCMLLGSLLECCNHQARFLAVGLRGQGFSHVLTETKFKNRWITLETCRNVKAGWQPQNITTRMYAHV